LVLIGAEMKQEECGNDYRIWIMALQKNIKCIPMSDLVEKFKKVLKNKGNQPGVVHFDAIELGMTRKAMIAASEYIINNNIDMGDGWHMISNNEPQFPDDKYKKFEYCHALADSKLMCLKED
jgi:hypothetical protein